MEHGQSGETVAYHAARLLLLIRYCGKLHGTGDAQLPAIEGRTLLAKLDFFLRYPIYLKRAAEIRNREWANRFGSFTDADFGLATDTDGYTIESRMIRYKYGPWDHIYYVALAYLVGKQLITIDTKGSTEVFRLTERGRDVADALADQPAYEDITSRARTAFRLFSRYKGSGLKEFIYNNFPEIVNRKIGEVI